ncbi:Glucoamylase (glucan-1,4-alpha-glucosidase), GH15 family [Pseudomonas chlororaphis]|uniref:glycoside hydrolase family 15 protein n=1 Tax=Pseudomonas chlororaphis TaxID=587753 RepID=UPI00087D8443|nr:glycoside hydrolase family 15 protein [Pseudomonas chlororaphis]AZD62012.1 Glucoamylase [Pseudomonas chlororaphis subsp. aurantiaca]AZD68370.1 Glucoamylase [Pseudomonas chlororaphis subsp. aurantiaca]QIT24262.1 glycoside hydrolase family 15 protein [Pseudomonas chlororaphis subsp. aurantiaca]UVE43798.1 glycoside hydrolase family 15 protein [Pseudomonas chlororaphis]WDH02376.1 glycoside hydrolase family 15 protein [Pseudomonas chlororaphis]
MADTERQAPIDAHGIIGDLRTAALVNDKGSVDFLCWPEFDSPSIFCSLLDTADAGIFQLAPDLPDARREQIYLPDSNVLQTRWLSERAVVEVTDLLPIGDSEDDLPLLIRRVRVVSGRTTLRLRCAVRHDYARATTRARLDGDAVCFEADRQPGLRLIASQPLRIDRQAAVAEFELEQEQSAEFMLGGIDDPRLVAGGSDLCLERTLKFWRDWIGQSNYRGRWREMVNRSALALKLLTSRKHGAIVAAATFGLPETPGGERNWDYRYTWIRDASFTVYAFMRLGFVEEANAYMRWLRGRVSDCRGQPTKLNILYAIDGRQQLPEIQLPHLSGHGGATPVRIGNQAYDQVQLDIFGELLDAVYLVNKYGEAISHEGWKHVVDVVDQVCSSWDGEDVGIWEMRGEQHHFLHSRLMCWVALDRAIRLASKRSLPAPFARWDQTRQAIYDDIWSNFWNEEHGHFVQYRGGTALDGSMLLMPLVRFVGARDPRWLATLQAIEKTLVRDGMVYRYRNEDSQIDGLAGTEGAFAACSFWYVECLARAGQVDKAHLEFEQLLRYANPLGLYAEEFDSHARHLGNTPQALTHLALISAASFLNRRLSAEKILWQP